MNVEEMMSVKDWNPNVCVAFNKTKETWGGFSNMCAGFPIEVNDETVRTSEALFQAMKFPEHEDVQREILDQKSPIAAKMVAQKHDNKRRSDWFDGGLNFRVMRWCVRAKAMQNLKFGNLLEESGDRDIVELRTRKGEDVWSVKLLGSSSGELYRGINAMGRILMDVRYDWNGDELDSSDPDESFDEDGNQWPAYGLSPLSIHDFLFLGAVPEVGSRLGED